MKIKKIIIQIFGFSMLICPGIDARSKSKPVIKKAITQVIHIKNTAVEPILHRLC